MPSLGHGEEEEDEESIDPLPEKLKGSVVSAFDLFSEYSKTLSFHLGIHKNNQMYSSTI